jgi:serine protease
MPPILVFALLVAALPGIARAAPPARVIVAFKPEAPLLERKAAAPAGEPARRARELGNRVGVPLRAGIAVSDRMQVVLAEGTSSQALALRLAQQPDVAYAVPDLRRRAHVRPNDPLYGDGVAGNGPAAGQWYLRTPAGEVRSAIDAEGAWRHTTGERSIVVAVLDTGVRFEHPDLRRVADGGNLLPGYDFVADVDTANDGDGRDPDASDPGDWITAEEDARAGGPFEGCEASPSSWHGTKVAGVIAATTDNATGMASVARSVRLLPVRVLGKCGGFDSDIIAGMRWAAGLHVPGVPDNPDRARVLNLSLGSEAPCTAAYQQAIDEVNAAGAVVVASAGNSAGHATGTPANCIGAIAVAGVRHAGTKVGFSDLGPEIAISAPAGNCVNVAPGTPCLYPILTTTSRGETTPGEPGYTDSFDVSVGTSFAAPLVSGTIGLMLSVQPALSVHDVRTILRATARRFPTTGGDNGDGTIVPQCTAPQSGALGEPVDQLQCYCTTATCGAGMLDTSSAVLAAATGLAVAPAPLHGVWWASPGGSEAGWGLNVAQQGDVLFATWFTYDAAGRAWWMSMTASRLHGETYGGALFASRGPAFGTVPFRPSAVVRTQVGQGTITRIDDNRATFASTVGGVAQERLIERLAFGEPPTCTFALLPDAALATNYQDVWWASGGSEAGWGLNLVHQGDVIFATWFTYDGDGAPLWLSMSAVRTGAATFAGTLFRHAGPPYSSLRFDASRVTATQVGHGTLTFADGSAGTFDSTVNGLAQSKSIARVVFNGPGTTCR